MYFIYLSVGSCYVCSRQTLNFFLPQSRDDLDVNPTKAHRCQPRLWPSPVLKHGIWGKIQIPKFRHVVESSAWGTQEQGKGSRTSEMVTFQVCLITDLSWSEQKLRHPPLLGDSYTCRTAWLALPGAAISLPLASDLPKAVLEVKLPFPHCKKSPELSFQFEISAISLSMHHVILISDALKPSSRPVFFNLSYLWYSPFLLQKHS